MCTYLCWPILYIRNFLTAYSVHIPPHIDLFILCTTFSWLRPEKFASVLFCIYFSLVGLFLHFMATCTSLWWCILYTSHLLVTYSVRRVVFEGLFCTHTSPCLTCSLRVPLRHDLVCILLIFMANFVYFLLLGELILGDILWLRARPSGDLFCTHNFSL